MLCVFSSLKVLITFLLVSHTSHSFFAQDLKYMKKETDALNARIIKDLRKQGWLCAKI